MYTFSDKRLIMLKPSEITASPDQPRKSFDEYELKRLCDSIKASGIIQPLIVRKTENGKKEWINVPVNVKCVKLKDDYAFLRLTLLIQDKDDD